MESTTTAREHAFDLGDRFWSAFVGEYWEKRPPMPLTIRPGEKPTS